MPHAEDADLRRMARAIDADREPRVRIATELSEEGVRRLRDILMAASADQLIEHSWPMLRMIDALDDALAS